MADKLKISINHAVSESLENMAFMEVLTDSDPHNDALPESLEGVPADSVHDIRRVSLLVHDPIQGEISLQMPKTLIVKITEAIYGLSEDDLNNQHLDDTLAEILNMIVGRMLNELLPKEQTYRLGLPQLCGGENPLTEDPSSEYQFLVEDEWFSINVSGKALLQISSCI